MQDESRATKKSISKAYESNRFNQALEETLHPGGIELTVRAAEVAQITEGMKILDIATGRGTSACFLTQQYRCHTIGIDLSPLSASLASTKAQANNLQSCSDFLVADAECLPFADATFDTVIGECSFSLLTDKKTGASEIARVLNPGGKLVLTDVVLKSQLSPDLMTDLTFNCCFSGAQTIEGYIELFTDAGLKLDFQEDHSKALKKVTYQVITGYGSLAAFWEQFGSRSSSCCATGAGNLDSRRLWTQMFREGRPGYALLSFVKTS